MSNYFMCGVNANFVDAAGSVFYRTLAGANPVGTQTTEANAQVIHRTAGLYSYLRILIIANATSSNSTLKFRKNGSDGNQLVTIGAGLTGTFTDVTNSDTVAAADKCCTQLTVGSTSTLTNGPQAINFFANSQTTSKLIASLGTSASIASTNYWSGPSGRASIISNTEAASSFKAGTAGTLRNLTVNITANTRSDTTTVRSRLNAGNGSQVINSITTTLTGFFEDTTHTDTVALNDLINTQLELPGGTGAITVQSYSMEFDTTNSKGMCALTSVTTLSTNVNAAAVLYAAICSGGIFNAIESLFPLTLKNNFIASRAFCYIGTNTISGNGSIVSRKNGSTGNISITITASTTGLFEDTTNTDSLGFEDTLVWQITGGTGGTAMQVAQIGVTMQMVNPIVLADNNIRGLQRGTNRGLA